MCFRYYAIAVVNSEGKKLKMQRGAVTVTYQIHRYALLSVVLPSSFFALQLFTSGMFWLVVLLMWEGSDWSRRDCGYSTMLVCAYVYMYVWHLFNFLIDIIISSSSYPITTSSSYYVNISHHHIITSHHHISSPLSLREGLSPPLAYTPLSEAWGDHLYYFSTLSFKRSGNYTVSFLLEVTHGTH